MGKFLNFLKEGRPRRADILTYTRNGMKFRFERCVRTDENGVHEPIFWYNEREWTQKELLDRIQVKNLSQYALYRLVEVVDKDGEQVEIDNKNRKFTVARINDIFNELNVKHNRICGITIPNKYTLDDFYSVGVQRIGQVIQSKDGKIRIPFKPSNNKVTVEDYLKQIYKNEYHAYKATTNAKIGFFDFLEQVYGKSKDNDIKTRGALYKKMSSLSTNQYIKFYTLNCGDDETFMFKPEDSDYMFMFDPVTIDIKRVNMSAIEKTGDDTYRIINPKHVRFVKTKINLSSITGAIDKALEEQKSIERWKQKEKKIAKNLNDIFHSKDRIVSDTTIDISAKQQGGGNKSDIIVTNNINKTHFYIESKLNYTSGEYFKFNLDLKGKHLLHRSHTGDADKNQRLDDIFGTTSEKQSDTFLGIIMGGGRGSVISKQIDQFYENITTFLKETGEWIGQTSQPELTDIKKRFFDDVSQLYTSKTNIEQMVFPQDLENLVKCFVGYIQFIKHTKDIRDRNIGEAEEKNPLQGLYESLVSNLNSLLRNKSIKDVEKFIDDFKANVSSGKNIFAYIYKSVISTVKRQGGDDYNLMLFNTDCNGVIPQLVDKINDYYANVHDVRYLEIGSNPFKNGTPYNESTWHSDIYVLEPTDQSVAKRDPLCLTTNPEITVHSINDLKNIKTARLYCRVSSDMKQFELKFFLGSDDNEKSNVNTPNGRSSSLEDLDKITLSSKRF